MELISYAMDFASFFVQNTKNLEKMKSIILFGSVARGEADKKSDVDIFIDAQEDIKQISKEINEIKNKFFSSIKFKNYWKLLGIKNEINVISGDLSKWKLRDSMLGSAIILYQAYSPKLDNGINKTILTWKNVKPNSRRVMLNKKLFGYLYYGRRYKGIIEIYNGEKLGANTIKINTANLNIFLKLFREFKIPAKILRVFEYSS